jgi:hypothetical protein
VSQLLALPADSLMNVNRQQAPGFPHQDHNQPVISENNVEF